MGDGVSIQPRSRPRFFVLAIPYFFGIVRRKDSVPGCWWRRESVPGLPKSTEWTIWAKIFLFKYLKINKSNSTPKLYTALLTPWHWLEEREGVSTLKGSPHSLPLARFGCLLGYCAAGLEAAVSPGLGWGAAKKFPWTSGRGYLKDPLKKSWRSAGRGIWSSSERKTEGMMRQEILESNGYLVPFIYTYVKDILSQVPNT